MIKIIVDTTMLDVLKEGKFKILSPKEMNRLLKETADIMFDDMLKETANFQKKLPKKRSKKLPKKS